MGGTKQRASGVLIACALVALGGCATGTVARSGTLEQSADLWTVRSSPQLSGAGELVGTASVGGTPTGWAPVAAARLLEAQGWPVVSLDAAAGVLVSDWQFFSPVLAGTPLGHHCEQVMALRLVARTTPERGTQLTAEAQIPDAFATSADPLRAVADGSADHRAAVGQARSVLSALRKAIVAQTEGEVAATKAAREFAESLDHGSFERCRG